MAADKDWGQTLLIGGCVVAAAGALWYLYTSSESTPRARYADDLSDGEQQSSSQETEPETEAEPDKEPLKNRLPPLPERPTGKRRAASKSSPAATSSKEDSKEPKAAAAKADPESDDAVTTSGEAAASKDGASTDNGDEAVLDWFQTEEEIIIYLTVSANADTHHVQYKLKSTYLEVRERGVSLIQAHLPHPVQVDGSNWQFEEYQGLKVIAITLQKVEGDSRFANWSHWKVQD